MNRSDENRRGGCRHTERYWVRSIPIRSMFRPGEHRDLQTISEVWGVPVATVVWAIVHGQLSRWRKRAPELGKHGLSIAAGLAVTRDASENAVNRARRRG
jgi:hypothetical protein